MPINQAAPKPIQVAAAVVGNALEWYDFIVFGFLTVVIARLFFPAESEYASLLLTTATFGVGFFMRPVGGILLGLYADHKGRKSALLLIIVLMTVAIAMIGFAPTYAAIGVAAPLVIVLARLLQGLAIERCLHQLPSNVAVRHPCCFADSDLDFLEGLENGHVVVASHEQRTHFFGERGVQ